MYQKCVDSITGGVADCIKRVADNAFIPKDPDNCDYQAYLVWLGQGNIPAEWSDDAV